MKGLTVIFIFSLILQLSTAPPVTQKKSEEEHNENEIGDDKETGLVSIYMTITLTYNLQKYD